MKKILLIVGIIPLVLPNIAFAEVGNGTLNTGDLINVSEGPIENGCSETAFQGDYTVQNPLQMAPVYVDLCEGGKYLDVASDATIANDGTVTGVSCELCDSGHYCEPLTADNISMPEGILSSQTQTMLACGTGTYSATTGATACTSCAAGTYQDTEGATSCKTVSDHYYAVGGNNDGTGAKGQKLCPTGYQNGTGASSIYGCQKLIDSCADYANNFNFQGGTGTMTPATLPSGGLTVNYRDISNHCFGTLECNGGYSKTQNVYQWVAENPTTVTAAVYCPVDGIAERQVQVVHNQDTDTDEYVTVDVPCNNGQEPGTVKLTLSGKNVPMASANFALVCSDKTSDYIASNSADYNTLTAESKGQYCYMRNVDFPDQPWMLINDYKSVADCERSCDGDLTRSYPFVNKAKINEVRYLVVTDGNGNYYAEVDDEFYPVVLVALDKCYNDQTGEVYDDITTEDSCDNAGNHHEWSGDNTRFVYNDAIPVNNVDNKEYVKFDTVTQFVTGLSLLTATDSNVNICTPNTVNITWGGVELENPNDPAKTCTYSGDLITPQSGPTTEENKLFLGWKPVVTTPEPTPAPAPEQGD